MNVIVDGLMTNYQKTGQGKVLLMIHGWGGSGRTFSALAEELKDEWTIVALDLPGFGASQAPSELWGTEDFANFVADFIDKLNLKPYAIIGHSFGGAVSIELAVDHPKFNKLVLLASAGIRNKRPVRSKVMKISAKAGKGALYVFPPTKRLQLKRRLYDSAGSDAMLLPHMEKIYRKIITEDIRAKAKGLKLPVLLIYGDKDRATPASDGLKLHETISDSKLKIIHANHFLHQQEPEQVGDLVRDFLG